MTKWEQWVLVSKAGDYSRVVTEETSSVIIWLQRDRSSGSAKVLTSAPQPSGTVNSGGNEPDHPNALKTNSTLNMTPQPFGPSSGTVIVSPVGSHIAGHPLSLRAAGPQHSLRSRRPSPRRFFDPHLPLNCLSIQYAQSDNRPRGHTMRSL